MNASVLNKYGISFYKGVDGFPRIETFSPNLTIYISKYSRRDPDLEPIIAVMNLVLDGQYASVDHELTEWHQELGSQIFTGIINEDMTFDLFNEDDYPEEIETFPLYDIKEIFTSLLEFVS